MIDTNEFLRIEKTLQAAFQFLDFSDQVTHTVWYEALSGYQFGEVNVAVKDYIKNESKTPTVHDIVEYVRTIRERTAREAAEAAFNRELANAGKPGRIRCTKCNDKGFILIHYPTGIEAVRPCDCEAGHRAFGTRAFEIAERNEDEWSLRQSFGGKDAREASLIRSRYALRKVETQPGAVVVLEYTEAKR